MKRIKLLSFMIMTVLMATYLTPISSLATEKLPRKFDLRDENRVTKVEAQGGLGSCWALSTTAALESSLLTTEGITYDFSENNMVTQLSDAYEESFLRKADWGGDDNMAVGYYASWRGPVLEEEDPYAADGREENIIVRLGCDTVKHVQEALFLPKRKSPEDNNLIKKMLMDHGGISMAMWKGTPSTFGEFYSNEYFAWYYPYDYMNEQGGGHSITLVGWDDDFSKENFAIEPPGDGAFIAKNTKGETWGNPDREKHMGGYFYISYYDGMLGDPLDAYVGSSVYTRIDKVDNYDHIYQYDLLGFTEPLKGLKNEIWMGNAFNLTKGQGESIEAISFYTLEESLDYEIYIQRNFKGSVIKSKLNKVQSGSYAIPGYHTVDLEKSIQPKEGEKVFFAVKLISKKVKPSIAIESRKGDIDSNAQGKRGESFINTSGSWTDLVNKKSNSNICLKIFTKDHKKDLLSVEDMKTDVEFFITWTKEHQPDARLNGYTEHQLKVIEEVREATKIPLTKDEFMLQMKRLFAMMRDGHTTIGYWMEGPYLNLSFNWLGEGIVVTHDGNIFKEKDKVLSIGGKNPDELLVLLRDVVSSENDYWIEEQAINYLNFKIYLEHLGLLNDDETVDVELLRNGKLLRQRVSLQSDWNYVARQKNKKWYETAVNISGNYGYIRYDDSVRYTEDEFKDLAKEINGTFVKMKEEQIDNLIIDYRNNPGGFMSVLNVIQKYLDKGTIYSSENRPYNINIDAYGIEISDAKFSGDIYILTSNYTYSAAVFATRVLRDNNIAVLIGEPTGENPAFNIHGNFSDGTLPFMNRDFMMTSSHKTRINDYNNAELSFYPDIPVFISADDLFISKDIQMDTLKKVLKGDIAYAKEHIPIKPSTTYTFTIKKGNDLSIEDKTIHIDEELSHLQLKDIQLIKLLTGEEVSLTSWVGDGNISLSFRTTNQAKEVYELRVKGKAKEYRIILRYPEFNIENGFIAPSEPIKTDGYVINNDKALENGTKSPLRIKYTLTYKNWNAFQMTLNKSIKVNGTPEIVLTKGDEKIDLRLISAFDGEKDGVIDYFCIYPSSQLEPGTYKVFIPSGSIESYYGETLEDIELEIVIP